MTLDSLSLPPRRSVVDDAFDALRARILHGQIRPGEKLPSEQKLAAMLGVSRGTVREVLNRLASARLLHMQHSGGKTVLDFREHAGLEVLSALVVDPSGTIDPAIVRDVTEMRSAMAPDMARRAAMRRTDAQAAELVALADGLPTTDLSARFLATLDFWTALVLASDNLAYRLAYNTLRTTYTDGRSALQLVLHDEVFADHYAAIAAAVANGDADRAHAETAALVAIGAGAIFTALSAL